MPTHNDYFDHVIDLLKTIKKEESSALKKASEMLYKAIQSGHNVYAFGAAHAGMVAQELFYRAGGLAVINPVVAQELELTNRPVITTSKMERLEGYGDVIASKLSIHPNDLVIIHSVSGRNPAIIDFALAVKNAGAFIIALTNVKYSQSTASRHSSKKRLFEIAHLVIDNHGAIGDAAMSFPSLSQKVGATSTLSMAAIVNSIVVETVQLCLENKVNPPIFYSANLDGGDEKNAEMFEKYKSHIFYM